jgi:hypothetical protein
MKHALAFLLLTCVLVAQDKPAAEAPKPAPYGFEKAAESKPYGFEKAAESKPQIRYRSINVRDELIVEISELKLQIATCRGRLANDRSFMSDQAIASAGSHYFEHAKAQYQSDITLLVESQRALILALAELAKEAAKDKPTEVQHSSPFPPKR